MVYVFDIRGTLESARSALPPISAPLVSPPQRAKFKAHDETISVLIYVNARRLIVTGECGCGARGPRRLELYAGYAWLTGHPCPGSTDNTLCLWTIMGEKMGTFGELEGWKLTPKMHDHARLADVAVSLTVPKG